MCMSLPRVPLNPDAHLKTRDEIASSKVTLPETKDQQRHGCVDKPASSPTPGVCSRRGEVRGSMARRLSLAAALVLAVVVLLGQQPLCEWPRRPHEELLVRTDVLEGLLVRVAKLLVNEDGGFPDRKSTGCLIPLQSAASMVAPAGPERSPIRSSKALTLSAGTRIQRALPGTFKSPTRTRQKWIRSSNF